MCIATVPITPIRVGAPCPCQGVVRIPSLYRDPATPEIYTLSLHDALPISAYRATVREHGFPLPPTYDDHADRSEEHTSELQSRRDLVCRLLLEKKKYSRRLEFPAG